MSLTKSRWMAAGTLAGLLWFIPLAGAQKADRSEVMLEAAARKERVDGDLRGAIALYEKLARGPNRAVAAMALVRMGQCYEKLGDADARKTYERAVREFGDQKEAVAQAHARLAALSAPVGGALMARRVIESGLEFGWGISLDGRYAAHARSYADNKGLFVTDLTTGEERRIASVLDDEAVYEAIISPDGKWICYGGHPNTGSEGLRIVGMDGSGLRTIFKTGKETKIDWVTPTGWTPDGREVLVTFKGDLRNGYQVGMISVETGRLRVLKEFELGFWRWASISPDGKWVAYNVQTSPDNVECDIHLIRTDGTDERKLVDHPADDNVPIWAPDGRGLVFRSNRRGSIDAWFVRVKDGQAEGEPEMIKADAGELLGVTRQGTLYYTSAAGSMEINSSTLDESTGKLTGPVEKLPLAYTGPKQSAALSPDAQWLAYLRPSLRIRGVNVVILRSMKTGEERELNPRVRDLRSVGWYPDGRFLVLMGRNMKDESAAFKMDTMTGTATVLYTLSNVNGLKMFFRAPSVGPDGKTFYTLSAEWRDGVQNAMIVALNSETKEFRAIFRQTGLELRPPVISPDGQHVAAPFVTQEGSRRFGLLVVNSQTGAMRELCATPLEAQATVSGWTPDSRNVVLVIVAKDPKMNEVWRVPLDGGPPQKSAAPGTIQRDQAGTAARTHSSGNRLVWTSGAMRTEIWVLDNALPRK